MWPLLCLLLVCCVTGSELSTRLLTCPASNCSYSDVTKFCKCLEGFTLVETYHGEYHRQIAIDHYAELSKPKLDHLRQLNLNLSDKFDFLSLRCNYPGPFVDILTALGVNKFKALNVNLFISEETFSGFQDLPYHIESLEFLLVDYLPTNLASFGFGQTLRELKIHSSKVHRLPKQFLEGLEDLESLSFEGNINLSMPNPGDFSDLIHLKELLLIGNGNQCQNDCGSHFNSSYFDGMPNLLTFNFTSTKSNSFDANTFSQNKLLRHISLENAVLLPDGDLKLIKPLSNLQVFHLYGFPLKSVRLSDIPKSIKSLKIELLNNTSCTNCETLDSLLTLKQQGILENNVHITCNGSHSLSAAKTLMCPNHKSNVSHILSIVLPLLFFFIVTGVSFLYFTIKYRKVGGKYIDTYDEEGCSFDAFVSFSQIDEEYVYDLVNTLRSNGLKVLIHSEHFQGGQEISENIRKAVKMSRLTLVLLSKHFLQSHFCDFEFKESMQKRRKILIVMRTEQESKPDPEELAKHPEIRDHVQSFTYLEESDPELQTKLVKAVKPFSNELEMEPEMPSSPLRSSLSWVKSCPMWNRNRKCGPPVQRQVTEDEELMTIRT